MKVVPLFTSAFSFKSILSLEKPDKAAKSGADSIISMCRYNKIKQVFLVEDNMAAFLQAVKGCGDKLQLIYGLRVTIKKDLKAKKDETDSSAKYVIFANNSKGYKKLIEIATFASTEGFSTKGPTLDFESLASMWSEDLTLVIPFYDSFIHKNTFYFSKCVPDFSFCEPVLFVEDNGLYFEERLREKALAYAKGHNYEVVNTQSIYYKTRKDFIAWQTYRCIQNRTSLEKPNLDYCSSDEFCLEAWKEKNK